MAFGIFVSKWRIFKSCLCVALKNETRTLYCCTCFHNFCINERDVVPQPQPGDPKELPPDYYIEHGRSLRGQSRMRDLMLQKVDEKGRLSRPSYKNVVHTNDH